MTKKLRRNTISVSTLKKFMENGTQPDGMPYRSCSIKEIKEFKDSDPKGYEELSFQSETIEDIRNK